MSIPYEQSGRARQKQRTRAALVAAARELVAEGQTPTVDESATRASVSRTTAYRYFPNQRALLVAAHPEIEARSLLPKKAPSDVAGRLDAVVTAFLDVIVDTEAQQRTMLRLSLDPDPRERGELPLRKGRAIVWIGEALSPLRSQMTERRLRQANLIGPAGYISMEDGAAPGFVQRAVANAADLLSVVEMGGASVASDDNRVTEAAVRGFWKAYRGYMEI